MKALKVAIRADASTALGFGHLARCLALADAVRARSGEVTLVWRQMPIHLGSWIHESGHKWIDLDGGRVFRPGEFAGPEGPASDPWQDKDASDMVNALTSVDWDWLIVDHYSIDAHWERALRPLVGRVLVIDDMANRPHECDVLLDQSLPDGSQSYATLVPPACRVLAGPTYALVRDEFLRARAFSRPRDGDVNRVLIFMGGGDTNNFTEVAVRACIDAGFGRAQVDVAVGAGHAHVASIQALCAVAGFAVHVQTSRMADLMVTADLAIGAAGSSSWERCSVGLPAIAIAVAENQRAVLQCLAARGAAVPLEGSLDRGVLTDALLTARRNPARVRALSEAAWSLVDGCGADRVCDVMEQFA